MLTMPNNHQRSHEVFSIIHGALVLSAMNVKQTPVTISVSEVLTLNKNTNYCSRVDVNEPKYIYIGKI